VLDPGLTENPLRVARWRRSEIPHSA